MNEATKLKQSLVKNLDKTRILRSVNNGIAKNGESRVYCVVDNPYTTYTLCNIECDCMATCNAIKVFLQAEGYNTKVDYHPVSCRPIGYIITV